MRHFSAGLFTSPRFVATRFFARLGTIAGILSGIALAFHVGGQDGYTVPLTALLGYPTDLLLRFLPHFRLASAGPDAVWNLNHVAFCVTIVANWTLIGAAMDLVRWFDAPPPPQDLSDVRFVGEIEPAHLDPLLDAFEALERQVREREPRREPLERAA